MDIEIGKWQKDEKTGRIFRKVGNSIEYMPEIHTAHGGTIYQNQLDEYNKRVREYEADRIRKGNESKPEKAIFCPFRALHNRLVSGSRCDPGCAWFGDTKCRFTLPGTKDEQKETVGKLCAVTGQKCRKDCVFYNQGCSLIGE